MDSCGSGSVPTPTTTSCSANLAVKRPAGSHSLAAAALPAFGVGQGREAMVMSRAKTKLVYHRLVIVATCPETEIWLGDDRGHFVQKGAGTLRTCLLPGNYTVEFRLGTAPYPICLARESRYTQAELAAGPTCARRIPQLLDRTAERDGRNASSRGRRKTRRGDAGRSADGK